jgi:hypothetical protein
MNRQLWKGRDKQKDALFHDAFNCYDCKCWWYRNKISIWLFDWMIQTPGENLPRVPFCSQQIPHTLVWYQTSVFGVDAGDWKEENICSCGRRCEDNCKMHLAVGARVLVLFFWISIRSSGLSLRTRQWQFLIENCFILPRWSVACFVSYREILLCFFEIKYLPLSSYHQQMHLFITHIKC